ncbi:hypothetical protein LTR78_007043 [Recurvomyces mirabilis]|uniref:Glutathione synthetase n=1 Tax=Recurvomyces mirabilis TaxID=574656 RepID=A0AAE0WK51_9PEZI|nr:hypothetical protein LTR78_007043 [Recurvomyces mirabilis]KAK5153427.1 hypothetical protein LTS14_007596 [Recurvomyces mirabilis]
MATTQQYAPPPGLPPGMMGSHSDDDDEGIRDPAIAQVVSDIKDYQITHGNLLKIVRFEEPTRVPSTGVNISCKPTPFPRDMYDHAMALQQSMNELYIHALSDTNWLYSVLAPQIESEPEGVMVKLWGVYLKCLEAGPVQEMTCGIFRSDYMLQEEALRGEGVDGEAKVSLKQVEMNTFSCAGICHSQHAARMHRYFQERKSAEEAQDTGPSNTLPANSNISSIVSCLAMVHQSYLEQLRVGPTAATGARDEPIQHSTCVLVVVQPFNFNIADERPIDYGLWEDHKIPCYRCEWQEVLLRTRLGPHRELRYRPSSTAKAFEVSVVYYRAGYDLREYMDDAGVETRFTLETSRAIKCPDVLGHLIGFKSVQRALTEAGVAERFLLSEQARDHAGALRSTSMPMYALDDSVEGMRARAIAVDPARAKDFVLKPNLEGGGNNVFGEDIPEFLASIPDDEWRKFILMRLITPPARTTGVLITSEDVYEGPVVSELGVLGFAMWRCHGAGRGKGKAKEGISVETNIVHNEMVGWTFKSKPREVNEMSVVKGYGSFDCPMLV